jgi:rubredoxin
VKNFVTIQINFPGGIISPGDLYNILVAATQAGIPHVSFGLRQQLLIEVSHSASVLFIAELQKLGVCYEKDNDDHPNIVSSYPAEEVFITNTWLSEGVYKDILDWIDGPPRLKINISDSNQSFTPMLTGNINWVAASSAQHFWHLFIRFPKTNIIYEWTQLVYTNDVPKLSKAIEICILDHADQFIGNNKVNGEELFKLIGTDNYIIKSAERPAVLPSFNLPYYEGLNKYNNKYWLGIYRRDELFNINFLKDVCLLCLDTRIGQLCSTPWKTIIVKGIEEKDKSKWNTLLEKYRINVRHAANELNFQVEDNCQKGLEIKNHLVKALGNDDTRTFGLCIGIKTRKKSEVFSSILIRRRPLINFFGIKLFHVYDILCARDFNPNERTGFVFSRGNLHFLLAEQVRRAVWAFYNYRVSLDKKDTGINTSKKDKKVKAVAEHVHQCTHCLSIYDESLGESQHGIMPGTAFDHLPADYCCPLCEAAKKDFREIKKESLGLQAI